MRVLPHVADNPEARYIREYLDENPRHLDAALRWFGGEEGGDGSHGRSGRADLQLVGIGTGEGERVTRGWAGHGGPSPRGAGTPGTCGKRTRFAQLPSGH